MSEELKPCPFCGGEARMSSGTHAIGRKTYRTAKCTCRECGVTRSAVLDVCASLDEAESNAADAWNRRAERTCRMVDCSTHDTCVVNRELGNGNIVSMEFGYKQCSECGTYVFDCPTVRYCPGCGAKVVSDARD